MSSDRVPVIALTGHLGAGKTTVLNHLLTMPGARIGVVVNDFGAINIDAGLVTGQIDTAASIAGGCVCCLPDSGGLEEALAQLTHPRLRADAVIVEASGVAEPQALARLIRFSGAERVRPGGLIDVIDADAYFSTIDTGPTPPARFSAATLVVINKTDLLAPAERASVIERIRARVRERNPFAQVLVTAQGRIDPALVLDAASSHEPIDELPLADLARQQHSHVDHEHAAAVTVPASGPIDAGRLVDLLEAPPEGVYRLKGTITVTTTQRRRCYTVNVVGRHIHIAPNAAQIGDGLVAIGMELDEHAVRTRLQETLTPGSSEASALRRLVRYRRLSV